MDRCGESRVLGRWQQLVDEMQDAGLPQVPRASQIRRLHYAGRSVVVPRTAHYMPQERITGHIARVKAKNAHMEWQEVRHGWVCPEFAEELNQAILLGFMLNQLVCDTPEGISLFGYPSSEKMRGVFRYAGFVRPGENAETSPRVEALLARLLSSGQWSNSTEIFVRE